METDSPIEVIGGMKIHPAASLFPLMQGEDFDDLVFSIKTLGVLQPIIVSNGYLIDGRNRLRAVTKLRLEGCRINLPTKELDKDVLSITRYIYELNFTRRHLTEDQMATICTDILPMIAGEKQAKQESTQFKPGVSGNPTGKAKEQVETNPSPPAPRDIKKKDEQSTVGQIAKLAGVSHHKARQAVAVAKAVEAGELPKETIQEVRKGTKKLIEVIQKPEAKEITSDLIQVEKQAFKKVSNSIQSYLQINGTSEAVLRSKIEAIFEAREAY